MSEINAQQDNLLEMWCWVGWGKSWPRQNSKFNCLCWVLSAATATLRVDCWTGQGHKMTKFALRHQMWISQGLLTSPTKSCYWNWSGFVRKFSLSCHTTLSPILLLSFPSEKEKYVILDWLSWGLVTRPGEAGREGGERSRIYWIIKKLQIVDK